MLEPLNKGVNEQEEKTADTSVNSENTSDIETEAYKAEAASDADTDTDTSEDDDTSDEYEALTESNEDSSLDDEEYHMSTGTDEDDTVKIIDEDQADTTQADTTDTKNKSTPKRSRKRQVLQFIIVGSIITIGILIGCYLASNLPNILFK